MQEHEQRRAGVLGRVEQSSRALALAVLLLGTLGSALLASQWQGRVQNGRDAEVQRQGHEVVARLQGNFDRYGRALAAERALFTTLDDRVSYRQFRAFVDGMALDRDYPGLKGMIYHQVVAGQDVPAFVAEKRADGRPGFTVRPPGNRAEHWVVRYSEPRAVPPWGHDTRTNEQVRPYLEQARDSGQLTLSGRAVLANDAALPKDQQPVALGLFQPMYRSGADTSTVEGRRAGILGWASAPFYARDVLASVADGSGLGLEAYDGTPAPENLLGVFPAGSATGPVLRTETVQLGGHSWVLRLRALPSARPGASWHGPAAALAGGLVLSALLAALVWQSGSKAAQRRVAEAELRRTRRCSAARSTRRSSA